MNKPAGKVTRVLSAAIAALETASARAAGYADHEAFRRSLVRHLASHPAFIAAVKQFHGAAASAGQIARKVVPAGRVQAPRHDSPRGSRANKG